MEMTVVSVTSIVVCLASSVVTSPTTEATLQWQEHYGAAKRLAQKTERPLLVVLENPANPAGKIDETKISEKDRQAIAKQKFELVRVDVNTDYGKRVAKAFGAKSFPYTAVTDDRSVNIVYRKAGPMSEKDWRVALAKSKERVAANAITNGGWRSAANQRYGGQWYSQGIITSAASCVGGT